MSSSAVDPTVSGGRGLHPAAGPAAGAGAGAGAGQPVTPVTQRRSAAAPDAAAEPPVGAATVGAAAGPSPGAPSAPGEDGDTAKKQVPGRPMGRTFDGTVFVVPRTADVLSSIFDPREPKTPLDLLTAGLLGLQVITYLLVSRATAQKLFLLTFAFWRIAYNGGLGWVLKQQSERAWIVKTVKREGWFDEKRRPQVAQMIKHELNVKMGKDYDFNAVPLDYNVWLLFRSLVDVILLNDFVAYSLFAFSCFRLPEGQSWFMHLARYIVGTVIILFNLWVKVDAHKIVGDFAWYWGDCFFLMLQNLVFDGVYEIAPDPMYSIGYAGYYGLSLMSGSYAVLFVSLAAHFGQACFLNYFENPHISRVYGEKKPIAARIPLNKALYNQASAQAAAGLEPSFPPGADPSSPAPPRGHMPSSSLASDADAPTPSQTTGSTALSDGEEADTATIGGSSDLPEPRTAAQAQARAAAELQQESTTMTLHDMHHRLFRKDTVIFKNLDLLRGSDFLLAAAAVYAVVPFLLPTVGPQTKLALLFGNALFWRLVHSFGLGAVLHEQSESRWMVRHYVKHYSYTTPRDAVLEAFQNWKVIYNTSLIMTYASFGVLCWNCYVPLAVSNYTVGTDLLRHTLGALLLALHVWAAHSSYKVLGPFGWLYGDFFVEDYPHQLYYTGIYRFLNNPERSMGGAAFFGGVLISGSKLVLVVAVVSHLAHWWFLSYVEGPHMRKLYGEAAVRKDSGVTRQIKRAALSQRSSGLMRKATTNPRLRELTGSFEEAYRDAQGVLDVLLTRSRGLVQMGVTDTKAAIQARREKLLIVRKDDEIAGLDIAQYSLAVPSKVYVGQPLPVEWTAEAGHSQADWIGLYSLDRLRAAGAEEQAEDGHLVTLITSQGHWVGVAPDEWQGDQHITRPGGASADEGTVTFEGDKLIWAPGLYELRYHHDGKHGVLARSSVVEVYVSRGETVEEVYAALKPMVVNSERSYAEPGTDAGAEQGARAHADDIIIWSMAQARALATAIRTSFAVDFDPDVVIAAANTRTLAGNIVQAKALLS